MITDSMTKFEVMEALRKDFDNEILPIYYKSILPRMKSLIQQKSMRENKTINLGWTTKESSNHILFKILQRGNKEEHQPLFISEFRWRNRFCFANFFEEGFIVVYQSHCLQRYSERVLRANASVTDVFYKYIIKSQSHAYLIVLPTPTHKNSIYFGIANALFLGDYDDIHLDHNYVWCNTCISYNETRYSQLRITKSLHEIQQFVEKNKYDLGDPKQLLLLNQYIKRFKNNDEKIEHLKKFLLQKYLLIQLHISFQFSFSEHFRSEIERNIKYLEERLQKLDISPKSFSPFSKIHGIAWKGEIDYRNDK